jgi:hypothetical protein
MKRRIRVAAASSLMELGALGLVGCGGDDDKTVTSEPSPTATEAVKLEKKSCGRYTRWTLEVEGNISCREARRLFRGFTYGKFPPGWSCSGPELTGGCTKHPSEQPLEITATFSGAG